MTTIRPFLIDVEDAVLADLKRRLEHTCFPDEYDNDDWKQGTSGAFLRSLCEYWRNEYDWRKHEAALNAFDHFETEIDGQHLHFIHQRSKHDDALPLLIQHGWPGSVFEFHKIIGPLTDPEAHGGDVADAFHVVCPSMPGYGWSRAPSAPGTDIRRVAELDIALMNALGYDRWVMQGGDWGAVATSWAAKIAPKGLMAAHFNMLVVGRPREGDPMEGVTEAETAELMRFASSRDEVTSYW